MLRNRCGKRLWVGAGTFNPNKNPDPVSRHEAFAIHHTGESNGFQILKQGGKDMGYMGVCDCPVCGGRLPQDQIRVSLEANMAVIDGRVLSLGPILSAALFYLAKHVYEFVSTGDLNQAIYGDKWPETNVVYMHIKSLRKTLEGTGWQIKTRGEWVRNTRGQTEKGYMLVREIHQATDPEKLQLAAGVLRDMGVSDDKLPYLMDEIQKGLN